MYLLCVKERGQGSIFQGVLQDLSGMHWHGLTKKTSNRETIDLPTCLLKAIQIFSFDDYLTMEPLSKPLRMNDTTQYITQPLRTETIFVKVITKAASLHLGLKF